MRDLKHIKSFNEATENLNISDVIHSTDSNRKTGYYWIKIKGTMDDPDWWGVYHWSNEHKCWNGGDFYDDIVEVDERIIERQV